MEIVYQFRTNTTTKEIYIYIKVYKNRRPFIKQPIGSQVTKKKKRREQKKTLHQADPNDQGSDSDMAKVH